MYGFLGLSRTALALFFGASTLIPLAVPAPAQAFCSPATNREWPGSLVYTTAGGAIPIGWIDTLKASAKEWNNIPGANWTISYTASTDVHFKIKYTAPAGGFGGVPAVAKIQDDGSGNIYAGDIYMNPDWSWNMNGNLNSSTHQGDVRTIAVHELGHELELMHPTVCIGVVTPDEQAAVMTGNWTKKWNTKSDDQNGAAYMK